MLEKFKRILPGKEIQSNGFLLPQVIELGPARWGQGISQQELSKLITKINQKLVTGMTCQQVNKILRPYGYFLGGIPKGCSPSDANLTIQRLTDHKVVGKFHFHSLIIL